jgi:O-antigen ligase
MPSHPSDNRSTPHATSKQKGSSTSRWIGGGIVVFIFIFAAFAPHSIAVAQAAWLLGMLLWVARFAFPPPPRIQRTPLDYVLFGFFILSGLSAVFSYVPIVSIGKMRAASLFTIVYLVAENVPSLRIARLLALTLIASCMVNALFTAGQMVFGRGIKVQGVKLEVPRGRLLAGTTAQQQLGISGWRRGRDWRATGFYGHWVTYAEALQLIASLALGFLLALPSKRGWLGFLLLVALAGLLFALALTVTRA